MRKYGFTLAEVLITLVVIGVTAAITLSVLISQYNEQKTVAKVKKMYSLISQVFQDYQFQNGCTGKVENCFSSVTAFGDKDFYDLFAKKINYTHVIYKGESTENIDWIPQKVTNINGNNCDSTWMGVWKDNTKTYNTVYALADGSIVSFHLPDTRKKSGTVFFDTNGVKGPNRIGKDQFPIGIGANNNPQYENSVHPYFNQDDHGGLEYGGLCCITNNYQCDPDICTKDNCSPTAYVLKYNKLPPL